MPSVLKGLILRIRIIGINISLELFLTSQCWNRLVNHTALTSSHHSWITFNDSESNSKNYVLKKTSSCYKFHRSYDIPRNLFYLGDTFLSSEEHFSQSLRIMSCEEKGWMQFIHEDQAVKKGKTLLFREIYSPDRRIENKRVERSLRRVDRNRKGLLKSIHEDEVKKASRVTRLCLHF